MIWNEHHECMDRDQLATLQGERLRQMVERIYFNVPFYRNKLQEMGIEPGDVRTVDDLKKLPFTTKQDLRDNYPFGLFAVPQQDIVRFHASSGTTGKSTVVGYTHNDILMWSEVVARSLTMAGVTKTTSSRWPTATDSSPAASACTTAPRRWALRSSRSPAATP